jgi:hypothetical protein
VAETNVYIFDFRDFRTGFRTLTFLQHGDSKPPLQLDFKMKENRCFEIPLPVDSLPFLVMLIGQLAESSLQLDRKIARTE